MKEGETQKENKEKPSLLDSVDFEILPTEKAVGLVNKIPTESGIRVTCRPTGYNDGLDFFYKLSETNKLRTILHLAAARVSSASDMDSLANKVGVLGVKRVFFVRGDGNLGVDSPRDTESLISGFYKRGVNFERIDVAGHPEGNPYDRNDVETLLRKQEISELLGVKMEVVTQVCFDSELYIKWLEKIRACGVYLPVRAGVLGKVRFETLIKTISALGFSDSASFIRSKPDLASKMTRYAVFGYSPRDFIQDLTDKGAVDLGVSGISVFTLGNITKSVEEINAEKK